MVKLVDPADLKSAASRKGAYGCDPRPGHHPCKQCQATRQTDPLRGKEVEVHQVVEPAPRSEWIEGRQAMQTPEDVQALLKLASLGRGSKRISPDWAAAATRCAAIFAKVDGSPPGATTTRPADGVQGLAGRTVPPASREL